MISSHFIASMSRLILSFFSARISSIYNQFDNVFSLSSLAIFKAIIKRKMLHILNTLQFDNINRKHERRRLKSSISHRHIAWVSSFFSCKTNLMLMKWFEIFVSIKINLIIKINLFFIDIFAFFALIISMIIRSHFSRFVN